MKSYESTKENLSILESAKCREIVSEIMRFGVNQKQVMVLIKLLALELEDREKMLTIINFVDKEDDTEIEKNDIII